MVECRRVIADVGVTASRADVRGVALFGAGRFGDGRDVVVAESRDLDVGRVVASRAGVISIPACFDAARLFSLVVDEVMAESRDLNVGRVVASRASVVSFPACLGAGSSLAFVVDQVMAESRDLNVGRVVTSRAGVVCTPACLGARRFFSLVGYEVVAESADSAGLGSVASRAVSRLFAAFRAGSGSRYDPFAEVVAESVDVIVNVAVAAS